MENKWIIVLVVLLSLGRQGCFQFLLIIKKNTDLFNFVLFIEILCGNAWGGGGGGETEVIEDKMLCGLRHFLVILVLGLFFFLFCLLVCLVVYLFCWWLVGWKVGQSIGWLVC